MTLKIKILPLALFVLIGCQRLGNKNEAISNSNDKTSKTEKIHENFRDWGNAVNNNKKDIIQKIYAPNAIKIISTDSIISGSLQIAEYYTLQKNKITSIKSLFYTEAKKQQGINYELVKLKTEDSDVYIQIVIWKLENKKQVIEFELTVKTDITAVKVEKENISERRDLWIKLCNENNAENLINQLYSPNTLYFNHKPLIKGKKNLIKEYAYMNNSNYNLTLKPLILEPVTENIAFEIGQCKGSYNGKYILIWEKDSDGKWKIFVDSNV